MTITPRSPSALGWFVDIRAAARRIQLKVPIRLIWIVRVNAARSAGPRLPKVFSAVPIPAQFTRPCTEPKRATAASRAAVTSSGFVTSAPANSARSPRAAATSLPGERGRSSSTTAPPAAWSRSAVARPRPEAPPVITVVEPAICMPSSSPRGVSPTV